MWANQTETEEDGIREEAIRRTKIRFHFKQSVERAKLMQETIMNENQLLINHTDYLRNYLIKNSIDEIVAKQIQLYLSNQFTYCRNLTFKKKLGGFHRVTVNSRVNEGNNIRIVDVCKLKYPPNGASKNGRANLIGEKILYATDDFITALKEARVKEGDLITISTWRLKTGEALTFTPIFKNWPQESNLLNIEFLKLKNEYFKIIKKLDQNQQYQIETFIQFLTDCFTKKVEDSNHFDYFLSSFYANKLLNILQNGEIDAILYPSSKENLVTTNIAMKHTVFEENYELFCVEEKVVELIAKGKHRYFEFKPISESKIFIEEKIIWND